MSRNRFLKLPLQYNVNRLLTDLDECVKTHWQSHFNTADYSGEWTSIALRSASGNTDDIYALPAATGFQNTPLLETCTYFKSIVDGFLCEIEAVRLLSLSPGSHIKEHRDLHQGYEYGFFRLHIPIKTVPQVVFRVDGVDMDMQPGECWYANFHLPHSVQNNGSEPRIHLIIDGKRNAWSDAIFAGAGYDFEEEKQNLAYDRDTKLKMIEALETMDTEASRELVRKLKLEIQGN
ncbi:MAG: aspartyl/asparaginyl beta-hydroxylase domain-containing protein [Bacteroidetes bacterium]|nr:aspartyl/asparaginyl beta-hydroxylase domain-containing protein [Bacteroidota bacterium]